MGSSPATLFSRLGIASEKTLDTLLGSQYYAIHTNVAQVAAAERLEKPDEA